MKIFDPLSDVENSELILDDGRWPNFHDAEVHTLNIWRGDIRPDDNVLRGPVIEVAFELCALENPYTVVLRFHDCEAINMQDFNHDNAIFDLHFEFLDKATLAAGSPLTPSIVVKFEQAFGVALSFRCIRVEALQAALPRSSELAALLASLQPQLLAEEYVFCTVPESVSVDIQALDAIASFREQEGVTLVLDPAVAQSNALAYTSVFRCITLGVHSSLDAVGLTAAVSAALAQRGISANVIAAYHHDHIFVPAEHAHDALVALQALSA